MNHINNLQPICGINLSETWAKAVIKCWNSRGQILTPGLVHFSVGDDLWQLESPNIRKILECELSAAKVPSFINKSYVETVSGTIFPESIWQRCNNDRKRLYDYYLKIWPRIKKNPLNRNGVYFQRLIAFDCVDSKSMNQLEFIIKQWESGNHRHSALQAAIFSPHKDHRNGPYLGFPCLQHVVFHPNGSNGSNGLSVVGFYVNQLLIEKAYGNYLGLYRLGKFMASQMGLELKYIMCIATNLKISNSPGKEKYSHLIDSLQQELLNV